MIVGKVEVRGGPDRQKFTTPTNGEDELLTTMNVPWDC